jgi:hypothetical protein
MRIDIFDLCCHGCGKVHSIKGEMIFSPIQLIAPDGKEYPARACKDCMEDGDRVHRAYSALVEGNFDEFKKEHWK